MVWAVVAASVVSAGVGLYSTLSQKGIANSQLGIEQDQEWKQDQSYNQLQDLMNNPDTFFKNNAVASSMLNQGGNQVARQMAAGGFNNSGNEATALQAYGQSQAYNIFAGQESLLAGMSGTGFNPSSAGSAASGAVSAAGNSGQQLAGMLAFLGSSGIGGGGGGGGSNPSAGFTGTDLNPVTIGDGGVVAG